MRGFQENVSVQTASQTKSEQLTGHLKEEVEDRLDHLDHPLATL